MSDPMNPEPEASRPKAAEPEGSRPKAADLTAPGLAASHPRASGTPVSAPMTVLVTGASGFVGAEVTARLTAAGHTVLAVLHRNADLVRNNGRKLTPGPGTLIRTTGDITRPGLGLSGADRRLAATADRIVHCAAVTDFGLPPGRYERVNVEGTRHVLGVALAARTPLVHVGTAYVCGERDGIAYEDELDLGQRPGNDYEKSKLAAETLVRKAAADGLPVTVVRPSIVTGASRTGRVRDLKTIYPVLRVLTRGLVRTVPGHLDAVLDLVPVDRVADLVTEAATRFQDAEGRTLHAVGHELTLRDMSDVLAEYPSLHVPRFVPPSAFSATALPGRERPYYDRVVSLYAPYFRRRVRFDATHAEAFGHRPPPTGAHAYLRRLLDHCLATGYLGPPPPREPAAVPTRREHPPMTTAQRTRTSYGIPVPPLLTCHPDKQRLYGADTYYQESHGQLAAHTADITGFAHRHALLLLKPDAVVARRLETAVDWLAGQGFRIVGAAVTRLTRTMIRSLWYFQWNLATPYRRRLAALFLEDADALVLLVRPVHDLDVPASVELTRLKGPTDPDARRPGQLRHLLGRYSYLLNLVHTPDEPADVLRELAVHFDESERDRLFRSALADEDRTAHARELAGLLYAAAEPRDLDFGPAVARLREAVARDRGADPTDDPRTLLESAWRLGIDLDRWDTVIVGSKVLPMREPGRAPVLDGADADTWRRHLETVRATAK